MLSAREAGELFHVEQRLLAKFVPPLRPEDVRRCLEVSAERHQSARVRTYLSILIERTAIGLLSVQLLHEVGSAEIVDLRTRVTIIDVPGDEPGRESADEWKNKPFDRTA